jgi:hypothetical protein
MVWSPALSAANSSLGKRAPVRREILARNMEPHILDPRPQNRIKPRLMPLQQPR